MIRALVIAGVSSGSGKTTVTLGLLEALRRRGLAVQAFKVGPDFIDPGFHERITGRPSYTLDGWMCPKDTVVATVARQAADADLAVIEGMMGCFDGLDGASEDGSTAQIAKWLGAPAILVVDAQALARSAGAVVMGFERFDPELDVAGVIFNRAGGPAHYRWMCEALDRSCRAVPVGFLPYRQTLALPERHLGLVTAVEQGLSEGFLAELREVTEARLDIDRLLALAGSRITAGAIDAAAEPMHRPGRDAPIVRIGIARDRAFQFYYAANLDLLRSAGASLVFWSPLRDAGLPGVDALYFGGGYPEVYARQLSANRGMIEAVRAFARSGRPIYAECGGLMYLAEAVEDETGIPHPMVGVLPATARMTPTLTLGYAEVEVVRDTPLAPAGTVLRGHEFHASRLDEVPASIPRAYATRMPRSDTPRAEGYLVGSVLLSYVHVHFGSHPQVAEHLVTAAARTASR